eukprot:CAMPEP_0170175684 /NCGR_PEP_ID=MMETSP0040_2-20121228/8719_1 /TAXON_ID=641309 /ORGANISM="Lotharella oceanica, Strain CCMP622" /LENGTH=397 /DNA_ID=CAMNT_0010417751 /DNA_START=95 /DNA_END=1288 /DNA_ORIENTATION=-
MAMGLCCTALLTFRHNSLLLGSTLARTKGPVTTSPVLVSPRKLPAQLKRGVTKRAVTAATDVSVSGGPLATLETERDAKGRERLKIREDGWNNWNWNGHNINYIQSGTEGPPVLLIHGFGAHAYHWRYQFPELSKNHRVYSLCLLGYGWSDKAPTAPYSAEFWADQVASFVREVIGEKAILVGNSIGAVTSLATAAIHPDTAAGLVMVNAAGRFGDMASDVTGEIKTAASEDFTEDKPSNPIDGFVSSAQELLKDAISAAIFYSTRFRIPLILKQVYLDPEQVDEDLVKSITTPALDPNALATFQSLYRAPGRGKLSVNDMMAKLPRELKVLLLWGQEDPWMSPQKADQIMRICDHQGLECEYVPLAAGHCPQDDNPEDLNKNLQRWIQANFDGVTS